MKSARGPLLRSDHARVGLLTSLLVTVAVVAGCADDADEPVEGQVKTWTWDTPQPNCTWSAEKYANPHLGKGLTEEPAPVPVTVACAPDFDATRAAVTAPAGAIVVDNNGLLGDGKTDDSKALQALLDKAGADATIAFSGGKTYMLCRPINIAKGQRLTRAGVGEAVLKRCPERTAKSVAAVKEGGQVVTVSALGGLEVGMGITLTDAKQGGQESLSRVVHTISAIDGKTLSFSPPLTRGFGAGATVVTAHPMFRVAAPGVRVDRLVIDGNREKNPSVRFWQGHQAFAVGLKDPLLTGFELDRCELRQLAGDAVSLTHCKGCKVTRNIFQDSDGSVVHLSSADKAEIGWNVARRVAAKAAIAGHTEGVVTWSLYVTDPWIHHNCIEDAPVAAFGTLVPIAPDDGGSVGALIERNVVRDVANLLLVAASSRKSTNDTNIVVRDNLAVDAGVVLMQGGSGKDGAPLDGVVIRANVLVGMAISIRSVRKSKVTSNLLIAGGQTPEPHGKTRVNHLGAPMLIVANALDSEISGNVFVGGEHAMLLRTVYGANTGLLVKGNQALGQSVVGFSTGEFHFAHIWNHGLAIAPGATIRGNTIIPAFPATSGRNAMVLAREGKAVDNCIDSPAHGVRLHGHDGSGSPDESVFTGNRVKAGSSAIYAPIKAGGLTVMDNTLQGKLGEQLVPLPTSKIANNKEGPVQCKPCWPLPHAIRWFDPDVPATPDL